MCVDWLCWQRLELRLIDMADWRDLLSWEYQRGQQIEKASGYEILRYGPLGRKMRENLLRFVLGSAM